MRATGAKVDGEEAEVFQHETPREGSGTNAEDELLLVVPQHPLEPGTEHEIEISHQGSVVADTGDKVFFVGARGSWYPNRAAQFAAYDVTYHYPKDLDLVSAGKVTEDRVEGNIRSRRYVPDGPIRMLAFNLGQYERRQLTQDGVEVEVSANRELDQSLRTAQAAPVQAIAPPVVPHRQSPSPIAALPAIPALAVKPADELSRIAGQTAAAVAFYRSHFGPPPLGRLEVSPVPGRFGQGFAGLVYVSTLSYLSLSAAPMAHLRPYDQLFYQEIMPAHEVAHQWWGNVVTTSSYHHEWLMESLANYSALMFLESAKVRNSSMAFSTNTDVSC